MVAGHVGQKQYQECGQHYYAEFGNETDVGIHGEVVGAVVRVRYQSDLDIARRVSASGDDDVSGVVISLQHRVFDVAHAEAEYKVRRGMQTGEHWRQRAENACEHGEVSLHQAVLQQALHARVAQ